MWCILHTVALSCCVAAVGRGGQEVLHCSESSEQSRNFIQKTCGGVLPCDLDAGCLRDFDKKMLWLGVSLMALALHPVKVSSVGVVAGPRALLDSQSSHLSPTC